MQMPLETLTKDTTHHKTNKIAKCNHRIEEN